MDGGISYIISALGGLCDCVFWIAVIGGALWFFVFRKKEDGALEDAASAANKAMDAASQAFSPAEDEDDVATVVAPQPPAVSKGRDAEAEKKPARPPRTAGATIIAFDDDDLLDE